MGAFEDVTGPSNPNGNPCANNDALTEAGPGSLSYTTTPFTRSTVIGGPIDATIYASATTTDTEFVATLEDVAPSGTATPITTGALLGSLRAIDRSNSWFAPNGRPLLPYHPYTLASKQAVPIGTVTRFDIEIRPTFAELAAGHRLRLTLTTSDFPTLVPMAPDSIKLTGGVYQVQRNASAASFIELLSAPATQLTSGVKPAAHRGTHRTRHRRRSSRHTNRHRTAPAFTG
jgi:predicted acyl esterase